MICTWKDCKEEATMPQIGRNKQEWANLCPTHNAELDASIADSNPKMMLRAWVRASGGADALTKKMFNK